MCLSDFDISWRLRHAIQETKILQLKSSLFVKVIVFAHTHTHNQGSLLLILLVKQQFYYCPFAPRPNNDVPLL